MIISIVSVKRDLVSLVTTIVGEPMLFVDKMTLVDGCFQRMLLAENTQIGASSPLGPKSSRSSSDQSISDPWWGGAKVLVLVL